MDHREAKHAVRVFAQNVIIMSRMRGRKIGDVEKECNKSQGYLARVKNGELNPSLLTAIRMASILDVSLDDLCREDFKLRAEAQKLQKRLEEIEAEKLRVGGPV